MAKLLKLLLLAAVFTVFSTPFTVWAFEIFTTAEASGIPGEYKVTVSVKDNPGISSYKLVLEFDKNMLTPISIEQGAALTSGMVFMSNITDASEEVKAELDRVTAVWASARSDNGTGELFTVNFRVNPAASGQAEIILTSEGTNDVDGSYVDFILTGTVIDWNSSNSAGFPLGSLSLNSNTAIIAILVIVIVILVIIVLVFLLKNRKRY